MYKTPPVKLHRSATIFSEFCMDMQILPSYTPIFLVDTSGRIVHKQKLATSSADFESIYNLADSEEVSFMLEQSSVRDAYAVKGRIDDGKNFIVVSKDSDGFSRCVVCSYSEDKCIRLHDYIEKLCSYKDYLDSFSELAFSSFAKIPAKRIFRMKISGALELINLASNTEKDIERHISFPVSLAIEKLCAFASKMNGENVAFTNEGIDSEMVVNAPVSFFRLVVSAAALVIKHSANNKVSVSVEKLGQRDEARIVFVTKSRFGMRDIYERELIGAFRQRGLDCMVFDNKNEYALHIDVPLERRIRPVLSDVAEISLRIDEIMNERILADMYFTISDI